MPRGPKRPIPPRSAMYLVQAHHNLAKAIDEATGKAGNGTLRQLWEASNALATVMRETIVHTTRPTRSAAADAPPAARRRGRPKKATVGE
jgi:hypothetical protein